MEAIISGHSIRTNPSMRPQELLDSDSDAVALVDDTTEIVEWVAKVPSARVLHPLYSPHFPA